MQFFFYCFCGLIAVSSDYFIYILVMLGGVSYQIANIIGYLAGTLVSFFLNRKITFGVSDKVNTRFGLFLVVACVGFLSSALILWIMVDILVIDAKSAKLLTLPFVMILQFSLNRRFTFKEKI